MSPESLLSIFVQAHTQHPADANAPFMMQTTDHILSSLMHPMLPGGGLLLNTELRDALRTLVQWGYLSQPEQYHGMGYNLTPAGLSYAARQNGSTWDGTERRQRDRRAGRQHLIGTEQRSTDRRHVDRRGI